MQIVVANIKGGCGKSTLTASLADVLADKACIVDHDNQGTLRVSSSFTGRHTPIQDIDGIKGKIIIHDTPPYKTGELVSLLRESDLVLIPTKLQYPDFLAMKGLVDELRKLKITDKGVIIFNEVRRPYNKIYHELKRLYASNYKDIIIAKTELSNLVDFSNVLISQLRGKAFEQVSFLVKELNISK